MLSIDDKKTDYFLNNPFYIFFSFLIYKIDEKH